jgi:hypothetical protein
LLAIFHGMAQGLLVIKHRAEIAHIKSNQPLKEAKLDRGRPMASANENS